MELQCVRMHAIFDGPWLSKSAEKQPTRGTGHQLTPSARRGPRPSDKTQRSRSPHPTPVRPPRQPPEDTVRQILTARPSSRGWL